MSAPVHLEAIVLRSMRYGEADRILHCYSLERGRISAIAKGARKGKSRFGGRLEPMMRVNFVLREGRSDLMTVTAVSTEAAYPRLRMHGAALDSAVRACDAVGRLFGDGEPAPHVFHLLANLLALLDSNPDRHGTQATQLAFRLKLLVAAGLTPQLGHCAGCGEAGVVTGFSGAAGGVVCESCAGGSFPLSEAAHEFMTEALGRPLAAAPAAGDERTLRMVERAIAETAEHHAHVRLRAAVVL